MLEWIQALDENILLFIQEHIRQPWMDGFWKAVTHLGDGGLFWISLAVVLLMFKKTRKAGVAALLALGIGALITNVTVKNIVARVRPYEVLPELVCIIEKQHDFSFPSGHTCASFAAACALYHALPRRWGISCLVMAALISFSRLYVGVHYPSDVLAGALIGIFAGWAGWKLSQKIAAALHSNRTA